MQYQTERFDKYTLLTIQTERLATSTATTLKADIAQLFNEEGVVNMIIDMSNVNYIDSSGLSAILVANRLANEAGGMLVLSGITELVMKIITICRLDNVFTMMPTVAEGVDAIFLNQMERDLSNEEG
ncbi:MAG: STAS domain-containing protein [Cytophagales bacterium]|nr:STAS domain-containing protein [Bernardetiaceae bacterium]MDW8205606.1 STAS domain-containing protein [Cytophagales bacterium]